MSADPTENDAQGPGKELEPVDSEVTPVGGTSKKLLELSEGGDQNTRAYRAPRELLELARRQRALGVRHSQPAEARLSAAPPVPVHSAPPPPAARPATRHPRGPAAAAPPVASSHGQRSSRPSAPASNASQQSSTAGGAVDNRDSSDVASSQKRRVRPVSLSPSDFSEGEAAPPRPIAEALGPRDRPTRRPGRSEESAESSAPSISYQPASSRSAYSVEALEHAASQRAASQPGLVGDAAPPVARSRPSHALSSEPSSASPVRPASSLAELVKATGDVGAAPSVPVPSPANDLDAAIPSSLSTDMTMARNRLYLWAIVFALFILLGFLLARWHVLDLVLPPAR